MSPLSAASGWRGGKSEIIGGPEGHFHQGGTSSPPPPLRGSVSNRSITWKSFLSDDSEKREAVNTSAGGGLKGDCSGRNVHSEVTEALFFT